jgi:NADPH-dependent ferric siderophore reductase
MMPRLVRVTTVDRITPGTVRITLHGTEIVRSTPDAAVKLFFPLPGQDAPTLAPPVTGDVVGWYRAYLAMPDAIRPPMRTYTVRATRPDRAAFDVDFVLHDHGGPASHFASSARPGDTIAFLGPTGVYSVPEGTRFRLLVGDQTALPAIASIIESAPAGTAVRAFVRVDDHAECQPLPGADIRWTVGGDLVEALRSARLEDGVHAWIAGEATLVRAVRRHLIDERGLDRHAVIFHGYWRRHLSEEDVGREGLRRIDAGLDPNEDDP